MEMNAFNLRYDEETPRSARTKLKEHMKYDMRDQFIMLEKKSHLITMNRKILTL